ncbi:MAG: DNA starvation/stationary phase protection protein Dps [Pseudomonadota bacterium]
MTMTQTTRLGLSANIRAENAAILQAVLADALDLRLATKHAHWTVKGPRFHQLHLLFDSFVPDLDAEIDTVAERIATLGVKPDGRGVTVAKDSRLATYPDDAVQGEDQLAALADRFAALGNSVRTGIDQAADANDADTSDILTGLSRFLDKSLWMLESHLEH